jgi:phospholipid/cholesterol/gamma-HCH transport system ATP-binding protein
MTSAEIDSLLLNLKSVRNTTLVVVTHNIPSARRIGDELVVMHEGHFIAHGTAKELDQSDHSVVREFMKSEGGG